MNLLNKWNLRFLTANGVKINLNIKLLVVKYKEIKI